MAALSTAIYHFNCSKTPTEKQLASLAFLYIARTDRKKHINSEEKLDMQWEVGRVKKK